MHLHLGKSSFYNYLVLLIGLFVCMLLSFPQYQQYLALADAYDSQIEENQHNKTKLQKLNAQKQSFETTESQASLEQLHFVLQNNPK